MDGQIYLGAIFATGAAFALGGLDLPRAVFVPAVLLAGIAGGAAYGFIPAVLRAVFAVNEIFVTVMLNFVAGFLTEYLATGPWNDPLAGEAITALSRLGGFGVPALIRALESGDPYVRWRSADVLRAQAGDGFGYRHDASPEERRRGRHSASGK